MSDRGENITIRTASQPHFPALEEDNYKAIMDLENGGELKRHREQEHVLGNESNNGFFCGNPSEYSVNRSGHCVSHLLSN